MSSKKYRVKADSMIFDDCYFITLLCPSRIDRALLENWAEFRVSKGDIAGGIRIRSLFDIRPLENFAADVIAVLLDLDHLDHAGAILEKAIRGGQGSAHLDFQIGRLSEKCGDPVRAAQYYRLAASSSIKVPGALMALAKVLRGSGLIAEAIDALSAHLAQEPQDRAALRELCWLQGSIGNYKEVIAIVNQLEKLHEEVGGLLAQIALAKMHICEWTELDSLQARLEARLATGVQCILDPYALLAAKDDPGSHLRMAKCISKSLSSTDLVVSRKDPRPPLINSERLRIAYLCGDFANHPTSLLMSDILESHNRSKFEISIFDYSNEDGSQARAAVKASVENFVLLMEDGPLECAKKIGESRPDIIVDLKGYTYGSRSEVLAFRPAPVQVNFLGYAGTYGAEWIDYVIADRHVLPFSQQANWTERIVHLPFSYYPCGRDRTLPRPVSESERIHHGIPKDAFVFACFNNTYKITREVFERWLRILVNVPNSVLWLHESNTRAAGNLRAFAARNGVEPGRLHFAKPLPLQPHLDRYAYVDLFLDTAPYGAHTTALDALWSSVPLVTLPGLGFASRVAASLLHAVGLPELICDCVESYIGTSIALAYDRGRLSALKRTLVDARRTAPLYQPSRFTADLERAYIQMVNDNRAGNIPTSFEL